MPNHMTRREALAAPFLAAPLFAAPLSAAKTDPRPNLLFILVDDLRFNALGYTGHPRCV